jgi:hypothetical protein
MKQKDLKSDGPNNASFMCKMQAASNHVLIPDLTGTPTSLKHVTYDRKSGFWLLSFFHTWGATATHTCSYMTEKRLLHGSRVFLALLFASFYDAVSIETIPRRMIRRSMNNESERIWMGREWSTHRGRNVYRNLVENTERKRPLERPKRRRKNVKMDLGEIGWGGMDWIHLA